MSLEPTMTTPPQFLTYWKPIKVKLVLLGTNDITKIKRSLFIIIIIIR
jgi:hypothetical protein